MKKLFSIYAAAAILFTVPACSDDSQGNDDSRPGSENDNGSSGGNDNQSSGGNDDQSSGGNEDQNSGGNDNQNSSGNEDQNSGGIKTGDPCTTEEADLYICCDNGKNICKCTADKHWILDEECMTPGISEGYCDYYDNDNIACFEPESSCNADNIDKLYSNICMKYESKLIFPVTICTKKDDNSYAVTSYGTYEGLCSQDRQSVYTCPGDAMDVVEKPCKNCTEIEKEIGIISVHCDP